jgi:drug/metabolite transporter (DMT)-like permease
MPTQSRFPVRLVVGLAIAVATDTALQLVWKTGIVNIPDTETIAGTIAAVAGAPIFIVVIALMAIQLVNWLRVLDQADLSYAKPFTSLSYVTVSILSVVLLEEHIAPLQLVGIAVIVAGVWCVASTPRTTLGPESRP